MHRLLELSLPTGKIIEDMALYASLGFSEHPVNEIVQHHYGVLGDGLFHIGLHAADFAGPTLTWVLPDVARYASALRELGMEFERADLGDDQFHQISFLDPGGQRINLLEARTFSPSPGDDSSTHSLGTFSHVELPVAEEREPFWQRLSHALSPDDNDAADHPTRQLVRMNPERNRLTVVYQGNLEALIVHSAREGWQHFAVTQNDQGLFRFPHQFDLLVHPSTALSDESV